MHTATQNSKLRTQNFSTRSVLVIIPAYNEAASLGRVVTQVRAALPETDVCVINDGSSDATGAVAAAAGAIVLGHPYNLGIGAAVQTGFLYAYRHGYRAAIRVDADDQHPPDLIPSLLRALDDGAADMIVGSRFLEDRGGYRGTLPRRIGIRVLAGVIGLITRQDVTDPTSGFYAANRRAIAFCAHTYPHDYPEPEARVWLHRAGLVVREAPVMMRERADGVSSITTLRSVYYMFKVLLALALGALRPASVPPVNGVDQENRGKGL